MRSKWLVIGSVLVFGFVFNTPRWMEMVTLTKNITVYTAPPTGNGSSDIPQAGAVMPGDNSSGEVVTRLYLMNTPLKKNALYIRYYIVVASCFFMVFAPAAILVSAIICFHRMIPLSPQRKNLVRILSINTIMFILCHIPKVIVTIYEIIYHSENFGGSV